MSAKIPSLLLALTAAAPLLPAQRPTFEVATVKANTTNGPSDMRGPRRNAEFVTMHNTQVYSVIFYAFGLTANYQIAAPPQLPEGWRWIDIEARADAAATDTQLRQMFRSLLEDRFKMKHHTEKREVTGYELTAPGRARVPAAREGDMTLNIEGRTYTQRPDTCATTLWREGAHLTCHAVPIERIVAQLANHLTAPVIDRTGLTGTYDTDLLFLPDSRVMEKDAPNAALLPDAIQDQLGLKLIKTTVPTNVLVIDHIEPPGEN